MDDDDDNDHHHHHHHHHRRDHTQKTLDECDRFLEPDGRQDLAARTPAKRVFSVGDEDDVDDGNDNVDGASTTADQRALSYWDTVMHLLIGSMSPTILNLPATFHQVGYVVGTVGAFVVVLFYAYCMHTIVACEQLLRRRVRRASLAYWEVLYYAFATGPPRTRWLAAYAKPVTYAIFIRIWGGGNCTYVLLVVENVKAVLLYVYGWQVADRVVIVWLTVPLVALCWIPNLKTMVVCSTLSNTLNAGCIVVIVYVALQTRSAAVAVADDRTAFGDPARLPFFLGLVFLTVNGTGLILSLKNQMKDPRQFASCPAGVLNAAYVPTGVLYAVFGLLCYMRYGARTADTVILNLPANAFGCVVQAMYALAVVLFYPLVTYVTFEILRDELPKSGRDGGATIDVVVLYAVKTANALFSIVLSCIVPNIALFISAVGAVCVSLDSIILPAIVVYLVHSDSVCLRVRVKTTVLLVLGVALMVVGFRDSYAELLHYYGR